MPEIKHRILIISGLSIASVLLIGLLVIGIAPNVLAGMSPWPLLPPQTCGEAANGVIQHTDKIMFHSELVFLKGPDDTGTVVLVPKFTPMDVKVADYPGAPVDLTQKVADALTAMGWTSGAGSAIKTKWIIIDDVEYSTYCTFTPVFPPIMSPP